MIQGRPYFVAALKRSGQHAIINWLAQQIPHDVLHFNNCLHGWDEKKLKPMKNVMTMHFKWNHADNMHEIKNYFHDWKLDLELSKSLENEWAIAWKENVFDNVKSVIYNIEDFDLRVYNDKNFDSFKQLESRQKILIVRSAQNFVASCLQRKINPPDPDATDVGDNIAERMNLWKQHSQEALNENSEYYVILFDLWFSDENYRKKICSDLGLLFTDNGLNTVTKFGSGSSFNRQEFDNKAQKMSVLNRWMQYPDQKELFSHIDKQAYELNQRLFNFGLKKD